MYVHSLIHFSFFLFFLKKNPACLQDHGLISVSFRFVLFCFVLFPSYFTLLYLALLPPPPPAPPRGPGPLFYIASGAERGSCGWACK